ncbi:predicted protein [Lichtheimia corymbifera JMRC:FSU:9682]|uniref:Uncharacterized protein n=1 Tax=Lichtheimia corymbifera JMRC:FSU:9682 TaxID=1263082 RepID=A0A068S9Q9_9FUNG|nr:predicted protein [Lichtheimia corymbifera JMRC:FSU:9682]
MHQIHSSCREEDPSYILCKPGILATPWNTIVAGFFSKSSSQSRGDGDVGLCRLLTWQSHHHPPPIVASLPLLLVEREE